MKIEGAIGTEFLAGFHKDGLRKSDFNNPWFLAEHFRSSYTPIYASY